MDMRYRAMARSWGPGLKCPSTSSSPCTCSKATGSTGPAARIRTTSSAWAMHARSTRPCSTRPPRWASGWPMIMGWICSLQVSCWDSAWSTMSAMSSTRPTPWSAKYPGACSRRERDVSALDVVLRGVCEAMGGAIGQVWIPDARGTALFLSVILLVLHRLLRWARGAIRLCQVDERRQFAAEVAFLHARDGFALKTRDDLLEGSRELSQGELSCLQQGQRVGDVAFQAPLDLAQRRGYRVECKDLQITESSQEKATLLPATRKRDEIARRSALDIEVDLALHLSQSAGKVLVVAGDELHGVVQVLRDRPVALDDHQGAANKIQPAAAAEHLPQSVQEALDVLAGRLQALHPACLRRPSRMCSATPSHARA